MLLSVEFSDGQKRTLTAGEITKEEIIDSGIPSPIPRGRFIRDYIEIPSEAGGSTIIPDGMETVGVNYSAGHGTFTVTLPSPVGKSGKKFIIKDASGFVGGVVTDEVVVNCPGDPDELIQGGPGVQIINSFESFEFVSDGTQWLIMG